jgi:hypothetical protein
METPIHQTLSDWAAQWCEKHASDKRSIHIMVSGYQQPPRGVAFVVDSTNHDMVIARSEGDGITDEIYLSGLETSVLAETLRALADNKPTESIDGIVIDDE